MSPKTARYIALLMAVALIATTFCSLPIRDIAALASGNAVGGANTARPGSAPPAARPDVPAQQDGAEQEPGAADSQPDSADAGYYNADLQLPEPGPGPDDQDAQAQEPAVEQPDADGQSDEFSQSGEPETRPPDLEALSGEPDSQSDEELPMPSIFKMTGAPMPVLRLSGIISAWGGGNGLSKNLPASDMYFDAIRDPFITGGGTLNNIDVSYRILLDCYEDDGGAKLGQIVTYCIDLDIEFKERDYEHISTGSTASQVRDILNNSYPVLSLDQVRFLWGIPTLTELDAYKATQYAIWYNTNNAKYASAITTKVNTTLSPNAQKLYGYLRDLKSKPGDIYTESDKRFSIKLDETKVSGPNSASTASTTVYGPYIINSNMKNEHVDTSKVYAMLTASDTSSSLDFKVRQTASGTAFPTIPAGAVPLDTEFYIHVNALYTSAFSFECKLDSTTGVNGVNINEFPYLTEAVDLVSMSYNPAEPPDFQRLLYHNSGTRGGPGTLTANVQSKDAPTVKLNVAKTSTGLEASEEFPADVFLVKTGSAPVPLPGGLTLKSGAGNIASAVLSTAYASYADYVGKGYSVLVVEKWPNYTDKLDTTGAAPKYVTHTTTASSGGTTRYYPASTYTAGTTDAAYLLSTASANIATVSGADHYVGYSFDLDSIVTGDTGKTITFNNVESSKTPAAKYPQTLKIVKDQTSTGDDTTFTFYVFGYKGSTLTYSDVFTLTIRDTTTTPPVNELEIFQSKILKYYTDEGILDDLPDTEFFIIEEYDYRTALENNGVPMSTQIRIDNADYSISGNGISGHAEPSTYGSSTKPGTSGVYGSGARYLGYYFKFSQSTPSRTIAFKNTKTLLNNTISISKTYDGKNTGRDPEFEYEFEVYHLDGTVYKPYGTFTLKHGESLDFYKYLDTNFIDGDNKKLDYYNKTFVIVETNFTRLSNPYSTYPYAPYTRSTLVNNLTTNLEYYYRDGTVVGKRASEAEVDGDFPGTSFTITSSNITRAFTNKEPETVTPAIDIEKAFYDYSNGAAVSGKKTQRLHLFAVDGADYDYVTAIDYEYDSAKTNNKVDLFNEILEYAIDNYGGQFYGKKFAIVEEYVNHDPRKLVWESDIQTTTVNSVHTLNYYQLTVPTDGSDPYIVLNSDSPTSRTDVYSYPGVEFTVSAAMGDTPIKFSNYVTKYARQYVTVEKTHNLQDTTKFDFYLYHVASDGTHTFLGTFKVGHGVSDGTQISELINEAVRLNKIPALYGSAQFGEKYEEKFVLLEDSPYADRVGVAGLDGLYEKTSEISGSGFSTVSSSYWYKGIPKHDALYDTAVITTDPASPPSDRTSRTSTSTQYGSDYPYPAYEFTLKEDSTNTIKISVSNYVYKYIENEVYLKKADEHGREPDGAPVDEDPFEFYVFKVDGAYPGPYTYTQVGGMITLERGEQIDLVEFIKDAGETNIYDRQFAVVEANYPLSDNFVDPYALVWRKTKIDSDFWRGGVYQGDTGMPRHGYKAPLATGSHGNSSVLANGVDIGTYGPDFKLFGCEFTIPAPGISESLKTKEVLIFTNMERDNEVKINISLKKSYPDDPARAFTFHVYAVEKATDKWIYLNTVSVAQNTESFNLYDVIKTRLGALDTPITAYYDYDYVVIEEFPNKPSTYTELGSGTTNAFNNGAGTTEVFGSVAGVPYAAFEQASPGAAIGAPASGDPSYPGVRITLDSSKLWDCNDDANNLSIAFSNDDTKVREDPTVTVGKSWSGTPKQSAIDLRIFEINDDDEIVADLGTLTIQHTSNPTTRSLMDHIKAAYSAAYANDPNDPGYRGKSYLIYENYKQNSDPEDDAQTTVISITGASLSPKYGYIDIGAGLTVDEENPCVVDTSGFVTGGAAPAAPDGSYPAVVISFPDTGSTPSATSISFTNSYTALSVPTVKVDKAWTNNVVAPENKDIGSVVVMRLYSIGSHEGEVDITFSVAIGAAGQQDVIAKLLASKSGSKYSDFAGWTFRLEEQYMPFDGNKIMGTRSAAATAAATASATDWSLKCTNSSVTTASPSSLLPTLASAEFTLPPMKTTAQSLIISFTNTYTEPSLNMNVEKKAGTDSTDRYYSKGTTPVIDLYLYYVIHTETTVGSITTKTQTISPKPVKLQVSPGDPDNLSNYPVAQLSGEKLLAAIKDLLKQNGDGTESVPYVFAPDNKMTFMIVENFLVDPNKDADHLRRAYVTGITSDGALGITGVTAAYVYELPNPAYYSTGTTAPATPYYAGVIIDPELLGPDVTVEFVNSDAGATLQTIEINKLGSDGRKLSDAAMNDAEFKIYKYVDGDEANVGKLFDPTDRELLDTLTLNSAGKVISKEKIFKINTKYTIVETKVPAGTDKFAENTIVKVVEVKDESGNLNKFDIVNTLAGEFSIRKMNSKDIKPLTGATFKLYEKQTHSNGKAYTFNDYITLSTPKTFVYETVTTIGLVDGVEAEIEHDSYTYSETGLVSTLTVTLNASMLVNNLPYGTYVLLETNPPISYQATDAINEFIIDGTNRTFNNERAIINFPGSENRWEIDLVKEDITNQDIFDGLPGHRPGIVDTEGLSGAVFEVEVFFDDGWKHFGVFNEELFTDPGDSSKTYTVYRRTFNSGLYRVVEASAPIGYAIDPMYYYFEVGGTGNYGALHFKKSAEEFNTKAAIDAFLSGTQVDEYEFRTYDPAYVIFNNVPTINIKKVNVSGQALKDAGFTLDNLLDKNGVPVGQKETDVNGAVSFVGLMPGETYTLEETEAPDGYIQAAKITFKVNDDGSITHEKFTKVSTGVYAITIENRKLPSLQVLKTDASDNDEPIEGVGFTVYDESDDAPIGTITTGTNGKTSTLRLALGKTYRLSETIPPLGYRDIEDITFTVDENGYIVDEFGYPDNRFTSNEADGVVLIQVSNVRKPGIEILKKDGSGGGAPMRNVEFTLYEIGVETVVDDETGEESEVVTETKVDLDVSVTGIDGRLTIFPLDYGKTYIVRETVPSGYNKMDDITFTVKEDGTIEDSGFSHVEGSGMYEITVTNTKPGDPPVPPQPPEEPKPGDDDDDDDDDDVYTDDDDDDDDDDVYRGDDDDDDDDDDDQPPIPDDHTFEEEDDGSFIEFDGDIPLGRWYYDEEHGVWIEIDYHNHLVWDEDNEWFIEFDEDGTPLGYWHWDEDEEMWIFDEDIPLGEFPWEPDPEPAPIVDNVVMPQTGRFLSSYIPYIAVLLGALLVGAGVLTMVKKRRNIFKGK